MALLGSALLAASARISLPLWPVPMTMQTLVVLLLGAWGGSRLGVAAVAAYLLEGALGLPVFTGGQGITAFAGPTAGYLLGFLPAAWLAGKAQGSLMRQGLVLLAAHLLLFVPGVAWLAGFVGIEQAVMAGFLVFVPGTLVKTALALAALRLVPRG
jgi:biotin transport system substrate-specific component